MIDNAAVNGVVVVGLAKTGTTAVAIALRNTLGLRLLMEPRERSAIDAVGGHRASVVKLIFDHWYPNVASLTSILSCPDINNRPATIAIIRDPRDEAVSRLHYAAYNYFATRPTTDEESVAWADIFRRKEATPDRIGLLEMAAELKSRFAFGFLPGKPLYDGYRQFIDAMMALRPPSVHLLRYEDFVANTIRDAALSVALSGDRDVGPMLRRVHRHGAAGDWQCYLTDGDLRALNAVYEPFLLRFHYPLERQATSHGPVSAHGSAYVERLIVEARSLFRDSCSNPGS